MKWTTPSASDMRYGFETEPKKFTDALKDALSRKQAAAHPDAKGRKGKDDKSKKSGTPVIGGRPVQRAVGRGG
jgi:hypothetical protein